MAEPEFEALVARIRAWPRFAGDHFVAKGTRAAAYFMANGDCVDSLRHLCVEVPFAALLRGMVCMVVEYAETQLAAHRARLEPVSSPY